MDVVAEDVVQLLLQHLRLAAFFEAAPRLKAVCIHGTGTDLVPLESAAARGVMVANLPGANAQSVAEYCVMAMLMLARNIVEITAAMRTRPWDEARRGGLKAAELEGTTVGVIGVGEIGRRVAKICRQGFGMRVLGTQRRMDRLPEGVEPASLEALLGQSDYVIVACPLNRDTRHLLNAGTLALMKRSAWLVNVGRGPVIDEAALISSLRERRIAGAMLDVYESYQITPGHPLFDATVDLLRDRHGGILKQGAVLLDPRPIADRLRVLVCLMSEIVDERIDQGGTRRVASADLRFVEVDAEGVVRDAGAAPHLDYRPLRDSEYAVVAPLVGEPWIRDATDRAEGYAVEQLLPRHMARVRRDREQLVVRRRTAIDERLTAELLRLDDQIAHLRRQAGEGRQPKMNVDRTIRSVKRHIGSDWKTGDIDGKTYSAQEISARVLQKLKRDAEAYLGEEIVDAVITVPAYFEYS